MQKRLSNTARVKYLRIDKERVIKELKEYALSLKGETLLVLLFGSLAKNTYTGSSDADLLIIVEDTPLSPLERIPHFISSDLSLPVEPKVYTKKEILKMLKEDNRWLKDVIATGIPLYQKEGCLEKLKEEMKHV